MNKVHRRTDRTNRRVERIVKRMAKRKKSNDGYRIKCILASIARVASIASIVGAGY